MEFEIPKRHILRLTLFIDMVQRIFAVGRGKRGTLVEKGKGPWQRNVVLINFNVLGGREDEDKRR
jgi:hypothetical protein